MIYILQLLVAWGVAWGITHAVGALIAKLAPNKKQSILRGTDELANGLGIMAVVALLLIMLDKMLS